MEDKVKALTNTQLIELAEELKKPTHAPDSLIRQVIGEGDYYILRVIELNSVLLHELADRFGRMDRWVKNRKDLI